LRGSDTFNEKVIKMQTNVIRKPILRLKLKTEKAPALSDARALPGTPSDNDGSGDGPLLADPQVAVKRKEKDIPKLSRARYREVRQILAERFPKCFRERKAAMPKRPLQIGIGLSVLAAVPELSLCDVENALENYTNSSEYLRNLIEGTARIGLDGEPAGVVAADEAQYAQKRLAWRRP
jgi:ProQ/FINO family